MTNFYENECITNYITLTLNEDFPNDYCWYKDIQDKISYIMNGDEKIDNIDTDYIINANTNFRIFFKNKFNDLSYFLTYNPNHWSYSSCRNNYGFKNKILSIDLSNFDTSLVTTMDSMFSQCNSLESIDLSNINTSNVESMSNLFYDCSSMESIQFTPLNLSEKEASIVISVLDFIFRNASKFDVDDNILNQELQQLGLPQEIAESISKVFKREKNKLREFLKFDVFSFNSINNIDYKFSYSLCNQFNNFDYINEKESEEINDQNYT
jgi:surface protein